MQIHYDIEAEIGATHKASSYQIKPDKAKIAIVSAGTSDQKVVLETLSSLYHFGHAANVYTDIGVASLSRLLHRLDEIKSHKIAIAIAGMEASLPTVLSSLCHLPVIAVPTSVGHGANFFGISALLSTLSSCSPGMVSVNIDGGFSAAAFASKML